MKPRRTSIEAFATITQNKLLSKRRLEVYNFLYHNGPCTQREAFKGLSSQGDNYGAIAGRFSELERCGVIEIVGEKHDEQTNSTVLVWDVTPSLPVKIDKPITKKMKKEGVLKRIEQLGLELPEEYKERLRDIYRLVKDI